VTCSSYARRTASSAAWIGDRPAHWDEVRLKFALGLVTVKAPNDGPKIALENIESWTGRYLETTTEFEGDGTAFDAGDVLFGKLRPYLAKALVADAPGQAVGDFHVLRPRPEVASRFALYYLLSREVIAVVDGSTYGAKMPRAGWDFISNLPFPLPPRSEQIAIAAFLDRETGKIDALVEEQRRLIELLKEKRQAVISHAVTKGLDPNAKMKPSGIKWLGDIPAHWTVCALKHRYEVALGKMLDEKRITGAHLGPYLRNSDVQWGRINTFDLPEMDFSGDDLDRYSLRTGDLLVCEGGEVGRAAVWRGELETCFYQKALHRLRARDPQSDRADFLYYALVSASASGIFAGSEGRSTIAHLPADTFRQYRFPFPPQHEQAAIVARAESAAGEVERLVDAAKSAIGLLRERRAALISAAVTGKIDVRDAAPADVEAA
jgi:type I restriction enzyme S subunit